MFYENQHIHNADSPRQQFTPAWLSGKSLRAQNQHITQLTDIENIDHLDIEEDIAQGFIAIDHHGNYLTWTYKVPPGVYPIYGFLEGSIDVPLPELYITGRYRLSRNRMGAYSISVVNIYVGSHYLQFLPLSNLYSYNQHPYDLRGDRDYPTPDYSHHEQIYYTYFCEGSVLRDVVKNATSIPEILNKTANYLLPFMMNHGNTDLTLYQNTLIEDRTTAYNISNQIAIYKDTSSERQKKADQFEYYWVFLNYLLSRETPENIYQKLKECRSAKNIFTVFNIQKQDIHQHRNAYIKENLLLLRNP